MKSFAIYFLGSLSILACGGQAPQTDETAGSADSDHVHGQLHGDASVADVGSATADASVANDDAGSAQQTETGSSASSCIGSALMNKLGKKRMLVGATMADSSASAAPWDFRYLYIAGGLMDSSNVCSSCSANCTSNGVTCASSGPGCAWWGCWQWDQQPPGQYARDFFTKAEAASQIPMITYDVLLQASGVTEGTAEATQAATNVAFMTRYFSDWRLLMQAVGSATVFLHIEPDFWGYAQRASPSPSASAAVASANPTDCASQPNSIAGMGHCMIAMARKYAPNALVGLHASSWSTGVEVAYNTQASLDVAGEAQKTATYLTACGADVSDFIVVEASDRDAGYYDTLGNPHWWDATNATLPTFHQDFAWLKALAEAADQPLFEWQIPIGNMSLANTWNAWHDNRVDYFFGHMNELAAAHVFAVGYGAGASGMTTPESDNGHLIAQDQAYVSSGGQAFCP